MAIVKLRKYFDLSHVNVTRQRTSTILSETTSNPDQDTMPRSPRYWQVLQYVSLVLGILAAPLVSQYQTTGEWVIKEFIGKLPFSIIIGVMIFPSVYKRSIDPSSPIFVQCCLIFTAGMGWQSFTETASVIVPNQEAQFNTMIFL